jgi:hypothetical protein
MAETIVEVYGDNTTVIEIIEDEPLVEEEVECLT